MSMERRKPRAAAGLFQRGLAGENAAGKMAISETGRKRLGELEGLRELRLSRIVRAAKPTGVWKKVLFVCPAGMESSLLGMTAFREIARAAPVNANLSLNFTGWTQQPWQGFVKDILGADFVVPMASGASGIIEKAVGRLKNRPIVIDADFYSIKSQYDEARYRLVLEKIRKKLERK